jgi:probable phosphoglycerate mutase
MGKVTDIELLLFASGATSWDEAGRIVGSCDLPPSEGGLAKVRERVAALLTASGAANGAPEEGSDARPSLGGVSVVLCGPDEASQESAEVLARATESKVRVIDALGEVRLGLWEGMLRSDAEEKFPTSYGQWREDPASVNVPEGESLYEAADRILTGLGRALDKVKSEPGEAVAVVLRPLALGIVRSWLGGLELSALWSTIEGCPCSERWSLTRARVKLMKEGAGARA